MRDHRALRSQFLHFTAEFAPRPVDLLIHDREGPGVYYAVE